jgi:hypothetical protein
MINKFRLIKQTDNGEVEKEHKTLKEISDELNVEIHIISKINKLTEGRIDSIKPHNSHKELYDKLKIYDIKKHIIFKIKLIYKMI